MEMSREALERELADLEAKNAAATGWGAAIGARHERIKAIRSQLAGRQYAKPTNLPVIPRLPPDHPADLPGNKAVAVCGECGRTIYQIEGYCCMNSRCPVQPRIT